MARIYLPTSPACFGCGQENESGIQMRMYIEDGISKVDLITDKRFCGYIDKIHGGVIFSILDEVMAWAPTYVKKQMCLSAEVTIRYLVPLPIGIPITVEGEFVNDRRLIWHTEGKVLGQDGKIYAKAKGKFLPISMEETLKADERLVYQDGMKSIFRE